MYIENLKLNNIRTFVKNELSFIHPDLRYRSRKETESNDSKFLPKPRLPNVNLLLGDNGSGKTTVLQSISLASLGPAIRESQLPRRNFVRIGSKILQEGIAGVEHANILANLRMHPQDGIEGLSKSRLSLRKMKERERIDFPFTEVEYKLWEPVYESKNDSFFCVAYGATRRVDSGDSLEFGNTPKSAFLREQRLQSIFQDSFALFPLQYWLPQLKLENPGRYKQVVHFINQLLGPGHYRFTEQIQEREYLFERGGMKVPFRSLSDGYRAFIAWTADLLYHICYGCPSGKKLDESSGIVLVDEIDLHLHPKWQMKVIETISKALPRMQFVFTSHSPLVVGSLEWMNIITLKVSPKSNRTISKRLRQSVHGLDADQILLTDFFGLKSTMAPAKEKQLDEIRSRILAGDKSAPLQLIREMSSGTEVEE